MNSLIVSTVCLLGLLGLIYTVNYLTIDSPLSIHSRVLPPFLQELSWGCS